MTTKGDDSKNVESGSDSSSNELTAEWTVHAQLTILQQKRKNKDQLDIGHQDVPVKVFYNWNTDQKQPLRNDLKNSLHNNTAFTRNNFKKNFADITNKVEYWSERRLYTFNSEYLLF